MLPRAAEDEGWQIGVAIDAEAETTDLALLDARDFEEARARIRIPHRVPPGFHGKPGADALAQSLKYIVAPQNGNL